MATLKKTIKLKFRTEPEYLFVRELLRKHKTNLQDFSVKAISEAVQQLVTKYEQDRAARELAAKNAKENKDGQPNANVAEEADKSVQPSGPVDSPVLANQENVPAANP